ncbi:carboxylesterase [Thozetella sp. PMI_491]|nr:carboxylesterase [Thozetella sp. PMI_491]
MLYSSYLRLVLASLAVAGALDPRDTSIPAPIIDLGYSQYQGYYNTTLDINVYRGVRYAAHPVRWQMPQPPMRNRSTVIQAVANAPRCPQSLNAPPPASINFTGNILGDEDCLFLNVFTPANAKNLPVLFWIHGGGYGGGSAATADFSYLDHTVNNSFILVVTQYRIGAFGFASSVEIAENGVINAGLQDVFFALKWVHKHISRFGGDPDRITVGGDSAGGGAAMLLAMANGGEEGTKLFRQVLADSAYLPTMPHYNDGLVEEYYRQLAERAGCLNITNTTTFRCLSEVDSITLQNASAMTSYGAKYGTWSFLPVTDGKFIREKPSQQLLYGKVNGKRLLSGANEAAQFVPQNISTEAEFKAYVRLYYPLLSDQNLTAVMSLYSLPSSFNDSTPLFDSDGLHAPYATEISHFASGWQQAANNLYSETTFVCSAYWLASAYTAKLNDNARGKIAWRYQFSVPDAFHAYDIPPLLYSPNTTGTKVNYIFRSEFQSIWGNFVATGDPYILVDTSTSNDSVVAATSPFWKPWGVAGSYAGGDGTGYCMLNLNVTNALPYYADWKIVDGVAWEAGRAKRCALWAALGWW